MAKHSIDAGYKRGYFWRVSVKPKTIAEVIYETTGFRRGA